MNLDEILKDRDLAILKKKSEIQKTDFSNVMLDAITKALDSSIQEIEVLIYEATISKARNEFMFNQYKSGYVLNHSVGMRYVKMVFCYDDTSPSYTQDKENWDKYYPMVLNKDEAKAARHFWAILEAKNIEASSVVKGSNFLTPVLSTEIIDEDTIKVKLAISPANIMDSHNDVHFPGIWKKSISEKQYDLLLQEHEMDFDKVIVDSITGELKVYTEMIPVKTLLSKFKAKPPQGTPNKIEPDESTQEKQTILFNLI